MDIRKIKKLIEMVEESDVAELEIREGEESVRISRHSGGPPPSMAGPLIVPDALLPPAPAPECRVHHVSNQYRLASAKRCQYNIGLGHLFRQALERRAV